MGVYWRRGVEGGVRSNEKQTDRISKPEDREQAAPAGGRIGDNTKRKIESIQNKNLHKGG